MTFLARHWKALAVVLVLGVLLFDARHSANRLDRDLAEARDVIQMANARAVEWKRQADLARTEADSLRALSDAAIDTATVYITRWRTRTDTLTVTQTLALADSAVEACAVALGSCSATVAALDATVAAQDSALAAGQVERDALDTYARELESRLEGGDPIWPTLVLTAGGGLLGYAVDGPQGAFVGAGVGLSVDVVRRGAKSLVRSLP